MICHTPTKRSLDYFTCTVTMVTQTVEINRRHPACPSKNYPWSFYAITEVQKFSGQIFG